MPRLTWVYCGICRYFSKRFLPGGVRQRRHHAHDRLPFGDGESRAREAGGAAHAHQREHQRRHGKQPHAHRVGAVCGDGRGGWAASWCSDMGPDCSPLSAASLAAQGPSGRPRPLGPIRSPQATEAAMVARISAPSSTPLALRCARQHAAEVHPGLAGDLLQPRDFGQRVGVVVGAQVEQRIVLLVVHEERRRLAPARVAAGGLAGLHGRDQPAGERQVGLGLVGGDHRLQHAGTGQRVAGDREALACTCARTRRCNRCRCGPRVGPGDPSGAAGAGAGLRRRRSAGARHRRPRRPRRAAPARAARSRG